MRFSVPRILPILTLAIVAPASVAYAQQGVYSPREPSAHQTAYDYITSPAPMAPLPEDAAYAANPNETQESHGEHGGQEGHIAYAAHGQYGEHGSHGGHEGEEEHVGWLLQTPCFLSKRGIEFHGFIDQGISGVANNPADGYNGVVAFNDRDGEYQMNQLWFTAERETCTGGCGFDLGGRVDFMYGTDARFMTSTDGLDSNWNESERFYGAALPQLYFDAAYNDWTFRFGKFFSFDEYEEDEATKNFFYSHSYMKEYGEPVTHTGMLAMYDLGDQLVLKAGIQRGWNQFEDTDGLDALGFLGGFVWTSCDERRTLSWGITTGEQGVDNNVVMYDLVATWKMTNRFSYVIQHDWGQSFGGESPLFEPGEWYGLSQYFFYEINPCWSAGTRFEWFRDDDGTRVEGHGEGNETHHGGFAGNFYELSLGLNWTPTDMIRIRPEVRWDWFEGEDEGLGHRPYDAGDKTEQFLFGVDAIVLF